jgi:ribosome-binding protein aMBF1 (putative translation factor)
VRHLLSTATDQEKHMSEEEKRIALSFGEKIRAAREALGLSQEEAAEFVDMNSIHFGRLERGEVCMKVVTLLKLKALFFYELRFTR